MPRLSMGWSVCILLLAGVFHVHAGDRTLDQDLAEKFRSNPNSYLDAESGTFVIRGTVVFNLAEFPQSEHGKLRTLMETAKWTNAAGQTYDLTQTMMINKDGRGGLGDQLAFFASVEFDEMRRNPFAPRYPASPYTAGMSAGEFIEELVRRMDPSELLLDGEMGVTVVGELNLPLHNLDYAFCLEVISATVSGLWVGPSGAKYDFRKTSFAFPTSELGTPEQRAAAKEKRRAFLDKISEVVRESDADPMSRKRAILATMNLENSGPKLSPVALERFSQIHTFNFEPLPEELRARLKRLRCERLMLTDQREGKDQ